MTDAELVEAACEVMHDAYEAAAVGAGWETNPKSRLLWALVPEANKAAMRAAVRALFNRPAPAAADAELVALLLTEARLAVKAITAAGTLAAESNSFHGQLDEDYAAWQRARAELRAAVLGRLEAERDSE